MKEPIAMDFLNAFVDDELVEGERAQALARLESDPDFKSAVCELRTQKELVRGAYADIHLSRQAPPRRASPIWRQALAAGLLLALGLGGGWLARDMTQPSMHMDRLAGLPTGYQPVALVDRVDPDKIILHLDSNEPDRLSAVLTLADKLLEQRGKDARLAIVVNSYGLNLLRQDISPYKEAIQRMSRNHSNLAFVACGQTVARLKREGVDVELIPEAEMATSAISEILNRMGQGWVYVKV